MIDVGVLGHGRFGAALSQLIEDSGLSCCAYDPHRPVPEHRESTSAEALVDGSRVIILAVPVGRFGPLLTQLGPRLTASHLVIDVGSVKVEPMDAMRSVLASRVPWVGSHPLFGPASLARGERPLRVVVCPADEHPEAARAARALFEGIGCSVHAMSAKDHDRSMASTHALTFFLAKGLLDIDADFGADVLPPSTRGVARAIRTVQADAGHLLEVLHRANPFAADARRSLLDSLGHIDDVLSLPEPAASTDAHAALRIPDLGQASPELAEVRDLIDELDLELVTLLARRGRLARRARQAKSRIGRGVRDPGREEALLAARRVWADDRDLDANRIESIFRAVLSFSVALQEDD